MNEPRILPCRKVLATLASAGKQKVISTRAVLKQSTKRRPRRFSDLELYWPSGLLLYDRSALTNMALGLNIADAQSNKITRAQLAVDCQVEQCQISWATTEFEPNADSPNVFCFQRTFLADQSPLVPRALWK